ncbi:class II aldolase [Nitrogeniibacter mangrovi]|uniref:Class II aldolase n=1 Tax=Nitrogeniibacter mangrovi TaxID=2016596 RepID=A0A6C1B9G4_9RHOO|nr:class II aldolase/adducin family protein [Nitrogeniibacter mangrovi]QID18990.1 class II aldolase [Nitrogeniibacter mangrovi]
MNSADQLLHIARGMSARRLSVGTAGNVSLRHGDGMLITPSGLAPERCRPEDMAHVDPAGRASGPLAPSSEWRMHRDIYAARPEIQAILHAHAPFATALACHRLAIPPFHYMIARFGGASIHCGGYATFGTQALSDATLAALDRRSACLMANHGMIVLAEHAEELLDRAIEFEMLCEHYWRVRALGEPALLSEAEIAEALARFGSYGRPHPTDATEYGHDD